MNESKWDSSLAYSWTTVSTILIMNLLPLVGLIGFGWGVTELLIVYWAEAVIATLIGMVQTFPARLVSAPISDPRSKPVIRARHGTVSIGSERIIGYVRNIPIIGGKSIFLFFWAGPMLALFVPASPVSYSSYETAESVVVIAGLLAGTHLLTAKAYFDEKRYDRVVAETAARSGVTTGAGVTGLVVVLLAVDSSTTGSVLAAWPLVLSSVIVGVKTGMELVFRCRNRDRVECPEDGIDPFEFQPDTADVLFLRTSGMKAAELPRVKRPTTWPQTTSRPRLLRLLRASPLLGLGTSRDGAEIVFIGLGILFGIVDLPLVFPLTMFGIAIVTAVIPVLFFVLPRHATLEYEFYDDRLVCHDYWLDEPVWNLLYDEMTAVSVERGLGAKVGGYGTVVIETTDNRPARLSYLEDYQEVVDYLKQRIDNGQ
ncbi:DUF6498-containing protein [Natrinema sp. 74]|uniref:DUF6498-containing protein n=1 Tax=Natrinema sp. 74 TaxID=3384159 RepID=UPI0038D367C7